MNSFLAGKSLLVALNQGIPSKAEALVCDDLRGPGSLFGEGTRMPRPLRDFAASCSNEDRCILKKLENIRLDPYYNCSVLWESDRAADPYELAGEAVQGQNGVPYRGEGLLVPATTYLAGQSTSSFAVAWELVRDGVFPEWSSVLCSCQTEGRGQMRRAWHSPRGNLHVSFRLPDHPALKGVAASLVTGYLLVRAFRRLGFPLSLKWPNDIILADRFKVGGILLEEKDGIMLAGLGVNLAEIPPDSQLREDSAMRAAVLLPHHAASVLPGSCGGGGEPVADEMPLSPFSLWKQLVAGAILEYSDVVARLGLPYVLAALNDQAGGAGISSCCESLPAPGVAPEQPGDSHTAPLSDPLLVWKGKSVVLSDDDSISGRLLGVGPGGGLLLALSGGQKREFFSGSLHLAK